jgi:hypothetical protein
MPDYEVGYGKPPKSSRFKPGTSGNPRGRPKREPPALTVIIRNVLSAPIAYREGGRTKTMTRHALSLKMLVEHAIKGDLASAELVLKVRAHAERFGEPGIDTLQIRDWLPDYPGQTGDQKTQDFTSASNADPLEWWKEPAGASAANRTGSKQTA